MPGLRCHLELGEGGGEGPAGRLQECAGVFLRPGFKANPQDLCCSEAPQRAGSYWGHIFKTVKWVGGPGLRVAGLFFSVTRAATGAGRPVQFGWAGLPGPRRGNRLRTQLDPLDLAPRGCKESLLP